ncbi:hypothetical protein E2C01_023788 [Portunus trituberculatus]|uniref:Uncharacterized protein n=1 Tax=Portunus trituberculatus TaxID=210409 RepID=A0A5B7E938_PORTR|nr:hypothetical protein [Portunus trituberculatus]
MNTGLVSNILVFELGAAPPCKDVVPTGSIDVEGIPTHGYDGVLMGVSNAQQAQLGCSIGMEGVAHNSNNQVLFPPLDVSNHWRYICAHQSQGPIRSEYLTSLSHGSLQNLEGGCAGCVWGHKKHVAEQRLVYK